MSNITSISTISEKLQKLSPRTCGGCTKCCEGWLKADIEGEEMFPGKPCRFKGDGGCTKYEDRPVNPCQTYSCLWVEDNELVPEHFKPDKVNVIMSRRFTDSRIPFLEIVEAGSTLPVEVLDWAIQNVQLGVIKNITYKVNGQMRFITSRKDFAEEILMLKEKEEAK